MAMASLQVADSSAGPGTSSGVETFCGYIDVQFEDEDEDEDSVELSMLEIPSSSSSTSYNKFEIPKAPPVPHTNKMCRRRKGRRLVEGAPSYCSVPMETKEIWDDLFSKGFGTDVCIVAEDDTSYVMAHYHVVRSASPVLATFIEQSRFTDGMRYIKIPGVPYTAVRAFIRFLYSSCYEEEVMKEHVLHLLVLSHTYSVPSLKRVCSYYLENGWLIQENVIDVLQLARECDSPRLSFVCFRMVMKDFKTISASEGWKVMRQANPSLEKELLEAVVETDSRKEERLRKKEERKVYLQLYEAMEALIHICRDGCRTIGPRDKMLPKGGETQVACEFPACKGLEALVRHFSICKVRVPGGCIQCKRMWQLLELHSRMCLEPDACKVPLCRHLKEKMKKHSKKDEGKWRMLVSKLTSAKISLGPFSSKYSAVIIL